MSYFNLNDESNVRHAEEKSSVILVRRLKPTQPELLLCPSLSATLHWCSAMQKISVDEGKERFISCLANILSAVPLLLMLVSSQRHGSIINRAGRETVCVSSVIIHRCVNAQLF